MSAKHFVSTLALAAVWAGLSPVALRADSFTWTDAGSGITAGGGTLSAHPVGSGAYVVDSGSGTFNGVSFTIVAGLDNGASQLSPSGLFIIDNVLYPYSDPTLDVYGLLFVDSAGDELNIWGNGVPGSYSTYTEVSGSYVLENGGSTLSIAPTVATPEPSALVLLGSGLLALLGLAWQRRTKTASSPVLS